MTRVALLLGLALPAALLLPALPAWAEGAWKPVTVAPSQCPDRQQPSPVGRCVPIIRAPRPPERPLTDDQKAHRQQLEDELRARRRILDGGR
jgi:hypothetical protein